MKIRKLIPTAVLALSVCLFAPDASAGKAAKPKKGEKAPLPPAANIEDVQVKGVWTRAARKGENAYIFLTVKNESENPVRLKGGGVDVAKRVRVVKFVKHGAMLRPVMVGPVPVEGQETYTFEPGIAAIELQELTQDLKQGDLLPITIAFARAGEIEIEAEIDSRSAVRYPEPPDALEDKKK